MTTIHKTIDAGAELTLITVSGHLTTAQILDAVSAFYGDGPTRFLIWDFSAATQISVGYEDFHKIVALIKRLMGTRRQGRTAFIKSKSVNAGLANMFSGFAALTGLPYQYKVFHSLEEAKAWLKD